MKVSDLIRELKDLDPNTEVKFFTFEKGFFGEYERTQIFINDISEGKDCLEILLGQSLLFAYFCYIIIQIKYNNYMRY